MAQGAQGDALKDSFSPAAHEYRLPDDYVICEYHVTIYGRERRTVVPGTITTNTLKELIAAGGPCKVRLVGFKGGFRVVVNYGTAESVLSGVR